MSHDAYARCLCVADHRPPSLEFEAHHIWPRHKAKLRALSASFVVFLILAILGIATSQVYLAYQNRSNGNRLIECTTPNYGCYERGAEQTAKAIGTINEVTIAANFCALKLGSPLTERDFGRFVVCVKNHIHLAK